MPRPTIVAFCYHTGAIYFLIVKGKCSIYCTHVLILFLIPSLRSPSIVALWPLQASEFAILPWYEASPYMSRRLGALRRNYSQVQRTSLDIRNILSSNPSSMGLLPNYVTMGKSSTSFQGSVSNPIGRDKRATHRPQMTIIRSRWENVHKKWLWYSVFTN